MRAPFLHLCISFLVISQWKLHLFKKQTGGRLWRNCFWFWFSVKVLSSPPFSLLYSYTCCYILKTPVRLLLSLDIQYSFPRLCSRCPSALFPMSLNLLRHLLLQGPAWMSSSQQQSSSLFLRRDYEPSPHASYLSSLHFLGSSSISCSCDHLSQ